MDSNTVRVLDLMLLSEVGQRPRPGDPGRERRGSRRRAALTVTRIPAGQPPDRVGYMRDDPGYAP